MSLCVSVNGVEKNLSLFQDSDLGTNIYDFALLYTRSLIEINCPFLDILGSFQNYRVNIFTYWKLQKWECGC